MTIHISIKNEDTRQNAVVEIISEDSYHPQEKGGNPLVSSIHKLSQGLLRGGESKIVYVTSTMKLEVIERQNG
jgi:hypothetical protein